MGYTCELAYTCQRTTCKSHFTPPTFISGVEHRASDLAAITLLAAPSHHPLRSLAYRELHYSLLPQLTFSCDVPSAWVFLM